MKISFDLGNYMHTRVLNNARNWCLEKLGLYSHVIFGLNNFTFDFITVSEQHPKRQLSLSVQQTNYMSTFPWAMRAGSPHRNLLVLTSVTHRPHSLIFTQTAPFPIRLKSVSSDMCYFIYSCNTWLIFVEYLVSGCLTWESFILFKHKLIYMYMQAKQIESLMSDVALDYRLKQNVGWRGCERNI